MAEETKKEVEVKEETKETIEVPKKFKDLVKNIEEMSVLELSELVKVLEDKFGVSAALPAAAPATAGGAEEGVPEEQKSSFTVEITEAGTQKIAVIKAVRAITELGLKDAKDLVDKAPTTVKENVPKEEAGAKVELK